MQAYRINSVTDEYTVTLSAAEVDRFKALLCVESEPEQLAAYKELHKRVAASFNDDICRAWAECETHSPSDRDRMNRAFQKFIRALDIRESTPPPLTEALRQEEEQADDAAYKYMEREWGWCDDVGGLSFKPEALVEIYANGFRAGKARRPEVTRSLLDAFSTAFDAEPMGRDNRELRAGLEAVFDVLYGEEAAGGDNG